MRNQRIGADLLCVSALMTTTLIAIKDYVVDFTAKPSGTEIKIKRAPLNQRMAATG